MFNNPDPVGCAVDQEQGGGAVGAGPRGGDPGGGSGGGGNGCGGSGGGGIQDKTDPTWVLVPASTVIPVELGLQANETTLMRL